MNEFQEQILDHYKNPRNWGKPSWKPTLSTKVENLTCGDELNIFLLIEKDKVIDVRFVGEGCSISIASASLLSEKIMGKNVEEINKYSSQKQLDQLGIELTPSRTKCALLSLEALKKAFG